MPDKDAKFNDSHVHKKLTELHGREELLRLIMESSGDGIYGIDMKGRCTFANSACLRMLGYSHVDQLLGRNMHDLIHHSYPDGTPMAATNCRIFRAFREGQGVTVGDEVFWRLDGSSFPVEYSSHPLQNSEQIVGAVITWRDITERKQAEEELRSSEERFKALSEASFGGVIIHEHGFILDCNKGLSDITGFSQEEHIGMNGLELIAPESLPTVLANIRSGYDKAYEVTGIRKDGTRYPLAIRGKNVPYKGREARVIEFRDITERKQSEENLRQSLQRLQNMSDAAGAYLWEIDTDMVYTYVTGQSAKVKGFPTEALLGHTPMEFMPAEDVQPVGEIVSRAIADKSSFRLQHRDITPTGDVWWEEVYGTVFCDESGAVIGLRGTGMSINDRKRTEEALHYSLSLTDAALESTADGILIVDREGKIARWNQKFVDLWRVPHHLLNTTVNDPVLEHATSQMAQPEEFLAKVMELYKHPEESSSDILYLADGRIFERYSQPQRVGEEIVGRFWSFRDITARKQAEGELKLSEQKFATIFNLMPDMVGITKMSDGCFIEVNHGFERWTGWKREEALGKSSLDLGVWNHEARAQAVAILQQQGHLEEFEFTMRTKSGEQRAALMYLLPIIVQNEKCLFFLARDVTELKRAVEDRIDFEKQLLHAQKLESLGVLAGGIAHDFNNILTAIIGNAELAMMRLNPESPALENLARIEKASARAADLAKQMLAYSGKGKFLVEHIDLNRLVQEMGHMLEVSISKKAAIRYNLTPSLPTINVDATQIRQIIMNLVINASEAIGDQSGVIAITTGCLDCNEAYLSEFWLTDPIPEGFYVSLEVADTGCGMDKATLAKIFDPFFTTKFTGRGLGMAAVLGIVRGHKGAIKVYSEPGKGSTFKVLLPAGTKPAELFDHETADDTWRGSGVALLVDDEETVRAIGGEMLRELGFAVVTANDGRDAIEKFTARSDISLIILDLTMPHMDGEQCFRELRQLNPAIKVIMSSGFSEYEVTQKFAGKGVAGFVQKPYKLLALKEAIKKIGVS